MAPVKREGEEEGEEEHNMFRGKEEGQENKMWGRSGSHSYMSDEIILLLSFIWRNPKIFNPSKSKCIFRLSSYIFSLQIVLGISAFTKMQYIVF